MCACRNSHTRPAGGAQAVVHAQQPHIRWRQHRRRIATMALQRCTMCIDLRGTHSGTSSRKACGITDAAIPAGRARVAQRQSHGVLDKAAQLEPNSNVGGVGVCIPASNFVVRLCPFRSTIYSICGEADEHGRKQRVRDHRRHHCRSHRRQEIAATATRSLALVIIISIVVCWQVKRILRAERAWLARLCSKHTPRV